MSAALSSSSADERWLLEGYRRLAHVLEDVLGESSVAALLERIAGTLRALVRCDDVVIWEACGERELVAVLVDGDDEEQLRALRIKFGEGLTGACVQQRRPIFSNAAHLDPRAGLVPGTEREPEAITCAPLIARGAPLGVLSLYRRGREYGFRPDELELVQHFAETAAIALDNARARAELEQLAATDDLTGIANRRCFRAALAREAAIARRYGTPLSLLLLDLDDFKEINDTFGHDAGDRVLGGVAQILHKRARSADLVARLGGDEFAVLLPQTDRHEAIHVGDVLVEAIEAAIAEPVQLHASVGAASLGSGTDDLLIEADRELYEAKKRAEQPTGDT